MSEHKSLEASPDDPPDCGDLRLLPLWTRRYAQHRTLPFIFSMLVFVAGSAVFAGLGRIIGLAYRSGNSAGFVAALIVSAAFTLFWVWLCVVGMRLVAARLRSRLYRSEGEVEAGPTDATPLPGVHKVLVAIPLVLVVVTFWLLAIRVDQRYMQPLTALWVVPFLVAIWIRSRSNVGPLVLLWPILYSLHAALVVLGAPILFSGSWEALNVFLPVAGYGLLAGLLGHLYSRYALTRIRRLACAAGGE